MKLNLLPDKTKKLPLKRLFAKLYIFYNRLPISPFVLKGTLTQNISK